MSSVHNNTCWLSLHLLCLSSSFRDHKLAENRRLTFPWPILKFFWSRKVALLNNGSNGQCLVTCNDLGLWCSDEVDTKPVLCPMYQVRLTISCLSCLWSGLVEGHCLSTGIIKLRLASTLATMVLIGLKWASSAVTCCACFELLKCYILYFILLEPCILLSFLSQRWRVLWILNFKSGHCRDGIGWKTRAEFVSGHWSVLVYALSSGPPGYLDRWL